MSLRTGMLTLVGANGEERQLKLSGKVFRIGSYLSCDLVLDNPEARSVHCEIQSDSFGRITITNHSKSNPVRINGVQLKGTRPLYTGSVITIFEKKLKWVNKHCLPRCKVDIEKLHTPVCNRRMTLQAPHSEPSILVRRKPILKRMTMYNLGSGKDLTDEDEEVDVCKIDDKEDDTRQELLTRASMISAAKTFGATPPRSVNRASNMISRKVTDNYDSLNIESSESKENVSTPDADSKSITLMKCQSSALVVTSYSPSATPTKSFACVVSNKTTPKSAYGTPRSAMSDLNSDYFLESNKNTPKTPRDTCSMFLIDFTTPDHYKTPLQKRTPLFRSAIKNSATKNLSKVTGRNGDTSVPNSVKSASNKKIRWELSNSKLKSEECTPTPNQMESTRNTPFNKSIGSHSSVKKPSNRLSSYAVDTPLALTRQRTLTTSSAKSIISASKLKPNLRRKSLNLSMPLKSPKAIFSDNTPNGVKFNRDLSAKLRNTPTNPDQKSIATPNSACKPMKIFDRSATFIVDTPTTSERGFVADEVVANSLCDAENDNTLNDTFTASNDNTVELDVVMSEIDESVRKSCASALEDASKELPEETNCSFETHENTSVSGKRKSVSTNDVNMTPTEKERSSRFSGNVSKILNSSSKSLEGTLESSPTFEANKLNISAKCSRSSLKKSLSGIDSTATDTEKPTSEGPITHRRSSLRRSFKENSLNNTNLETESNMSPLHTSVLQLDANKTNSMRLSFSVTNADSIDTSDYEKTSFITVDSTDTPNKNVSKVGSDLKKRKSIRLTKSAENVESDVAKVIQTVHEPENDQSEKTIKTVNSTSLDNPAADAPHARPERSPVFIGVKELLKTPKLSVRLENLKGVKELFNTPARDDLTDVRGVKELIKTPKLNPGRIIWHGVKELFNTPARDDLTNVVGVKELLNTPKPANGLDDPKGVKELFNSLKSPQGIVDAKGVRELFKSPQQGGGICDFRGVKDIFKTPKPAAGLDDGKGMKELFKTPKDTRGSDDVTGLQELFHTPIQSNDTNINGSEDLFNTFTESNMICHRVDELLKTPKTVVAEITTAKDVMKTPYSSNDDVDLNEIFKSPRSRKAMVVSTPNSVVVERVSNLSTNLLKTPKEVDVLEGIEEAEEIFNSPVSNLIYSCTESDGSENMSPQQSFDKLVGKPVLRRTYGRRSVTPRILPIPIAEENQTDGVRTDIQEWVDNVVIEKQPESTEQSGISAIGPVLVSPSIKANRKPLATSSSIKPPVNSGNTKQCPNVINLNEVSGIEQLEDSFLSSTEISDVLVTNDGKSGTVDGNETSPKTIQQSLAKLSTPQKSKLKNDLSKHALKVTPQIRRIRNNHSTPYSRKSSNAENIKDLCNDSSIQYIDESSVNISDSKVSVTSQSKRATRSKNITPSSLNNIKSQRRNAKGSDTLETSEVEYLSTSGSINSPKLKRTPRKTTTKSGTPICISDDESASCLAKQNASDSHLTSNIPEKTLEFVAMNELSELSVQYKDNSGVDALRSLPNALMPCEDEDLDQHEDTVRELSSTINATSEEVRKSLSYEEEEENLLNQYDTQVSSQELESGTFEVVYVDSNSLLDKSTKERSKIGNISANQSRRVSNRKSSTMSTQISFPNNSSMDREIENTFTEKEASSVSCISASKKMEDDLFANFVENPRIGKHLRRISHTPPKAMKINIKKAKARLTMGSIVQSDPIDVTAEKIRREFSNFNLNPVVRLVRGTSQIQLIPSRMTVSRRTVGNLPLNPCFDLQSEKNRRDMSIDFENFQEADARRNLRSKTLSPAKNINAEKNRRTMGQSPLTEKPFDYQCYSNYNLNVSQDSSQTRNRNKRSEFEYFVSDKALNIDPKRHTLNIKKATNDTPGKSRHSLGDKPVETSFNIQLEKDRRNLSLDFQNFEKQPTIKKSRGRSEIIDISISDSTVNRRTMGGKPVSEYFDLRQEVEKISLERKLEKNNYQNRSIPDQTSQLESPKNQSKVVNLSKHRFSVSRVSINDPHNRSMNNQPYELENLQLIQSSGNQESNESGLNMVVEAFNEKESEANSDRNYCERPSQDESPVSQDMSLPIEGLVACSPRRSTGDIISGIENTRKSISILKSPTPVKIVMTPSRRELTENELTVLDENHIIDKAESVANKSKSDDSNEKRVRFGETVYYEIEKNDFVINIESEKKKSATPRKQRKDTASSNAVEKGSEDQPLKDRRAKRTELSETAENSNSASNSNELRQSVDAKYNEEIFNANDENKENHGRTTRRGRKIAPVVEEHTNPIQMEVLAPRPRRGNKRKDIVDDLKEQVKASPNKAEMISTRNKRGKIGGSDDVDKPIENETNTRTRTKAVTIKNDKVLTKDESEQVDTVEIVPKTKGRRGRKNQPSNDLNHMVEEGQVNGESLQETNFVSDEKSTDPINDSTSVQVKDLISTRNETKEKITKTKVSKSKKGTKTEEILVEKDQIEENPPIRAGRRLNRVFITEPNLEVRSSPRMKSRRGVVASHEDPVSDIQTENSDGKTTNQKKDNSDDHDDISRENAAEQEQLERMTATQTKTRNMRRKPKTTESVESEPEAPRKTRKNEKKQQIEENEDELIIKEDNRANARNNSKPKTRNTRLKSNTEPNVENDEILEALRETDTGRLYAVEQQSPNESNPKRRAKRNQTKLQKSEANVNTKEDHPVENRNDNAEDVFKSPNAVRPKLRSTRLKSTSDTPSKAETEQTILPKRTRRLVSTDTLNTQEITPESTTQMKPRLKRLKSTDIQNPSQYLENDKLELQEENVGASKINSSGKSSQTRNRRGRNAILVNESIENISTPSTTANSGTPAQSEKEELVAVTMAKRGRPAKSKPASIETPAEVSTPSKELVGRSNKRKVVKDEAESNVSPKRTRSRRK